MFGTYPHYLQFILIGVEKITHINMINFIIDSIINSSNIIMEYYLAIYAYIYAFSTNHKYIGFYIMVVIIMISIFYIYIYSLLNIKKDIFSFIAFSFFNLVCLSYIQGYIYIMNITESVYLHNLSIFSYYKYILLTIVGSFAIIYWVFKINIFSKVNLKEEIRKILYVWNDGFIGDFSVYLYGKIARSKSFSYIYFFIHFILFYLVRVISLGLLINFVFFGGNLYAFIHLIPVLFLKIF